MSRALVLALTVALLAAIGLATPAEAAVRRVTKLSVTVSARDVMAGDKVRISGTTSAPARSVVALDRRSASGRWTQVYRTRVTSTRQYSFTFVPPATTTTYRVGVPKTRTTRLARSSGIGVTAHPCTATTAPVNGSAVYLSRPGTTGLSGAASNISKLICSAQPGARINIAMYFLRYYASNSDGANRIIDSLEAMVRYRGVRLRILLEGKLFEPGASLRTTWTKLRSFATAKACDRGCHDMRPVAAFNGGDPPIMHHKFMTISDMRWSSRVDPLVLSASGNWSRSQFNDNYQSTMVQYADPLLTKVFNDQFEQLWTCASSCSRWAGVRSSLGLGAASFALVNSAGVWAEPTIERPGTAGRGASVVFSPEPTSDRLSYALERYTCTPEHRTVRLAQMFLSTTRARFVRALVALRAAGCDVRYVSKPPASAGQAAGINLLRTSGIPVTCVVGVHEKLALVDAVNRAGLPDLSIWSGSQNLGYNALRRNDEALLRFSSASATGASATGIKTMYRTYAGFWSGMAAHPVSCNFAGH